MLKKRLPRRYVMTRFDSRRNMSWEIYKSIQERFGDELCKTKISESVVRVFLLKFMTTALKLATPVSP